MVDLRSSAARLIENPLVPVPPVEGVVARARRYRAARLRKQFGASVALVAVVLTAVVRAGIGDGGGPDSLRMVGDPVPESETSAGVHFEGFLPTLSPPEDSPLLPWSGQTFDGAWNALPSNGRSCPTHTNPAWAPIRIMANDVEPPSVDETRPYDVVRRMVDVYNFVGGICGRAIEVVEGTLGSPYSAENAEEVVAAVGMPLDRSLDDRIADGTVDHLGIPVVGGDGLTAVQHSSPLVYPVGTAASALTRTAVEQARVAGARNFAIVYDGSQAFAREAAADFSSYVARIGGTVKERIDLGPSGAGLAVEAERFRRACRDGSCDFVLVALLPDMAQGWLQTRPPATRGAAALPTLLSGGFPEMCFRTSNERCNGLIAWTGFRPWFETNEDLFNALGSDMRVLKGSAMTESAALAAQVLIEALLRTGPHVTRASLRDTLETTTFSVYPDVELRWTQAMPRLGIPLSQPWRLAVDDVASWSRKAEGSVEGQGKTAAGTWESWGKDVTTWAEHLPGWAVESHRRATDREAATAWADDAGRWSPSLATWLDNLRSWAQSMVNDPPPSKAPHRQPPVPQGPPMPTLAYWPYGPSNPPSPDEPHLPSTQKWWKPVGGGHADPG